IQNLSYERQKPLPVYYKGHRLDCGYRLDFLVTGLVVVELKAVEQLLPIHEAQVITYLRLGHFQVGLLMNFHSSTLKKGMKRLVVGYQGSKPCSFSAPSASPR
ncbi:MAG TPA: GxxExxY protein, partial [Acidobacteriota bacterium]|nr:GxxExxY protein [Acidobacteriota bacterium]